MPKNKEKKLNIVSVKGHTTVEELIDEIDACDKEYYGLIDRQHKTLQECRKVILGQKEKIEEAQSNAGVITGSLNKKNF